MDALGNWHSHTCSFSSALAETGRYDAEGECGYAKGLVRRLLCSDESRAIVAGQLSTATRSGDAARAFGVQLHSERKIVLSLLTKLTVAVVLAFPPLKACAGPAQTILADRDYVETDEAALDPAFAAFWNRFRASLATGSPHAMAPLVAFPLVYGNRCVQAGEVSVTGLFGPEVVEGLGKSAQLLASRGHPGSYFAVTVRYRDANEGMEEFLEFARVGGEFKLTRVGFQDLVCPERAKPAAAPSTTAQSEVPRVVTPGIPDQGLPSDPKRWFDANRRGVLLAAFVLYQVVGFFSVRAAVRRIPRMRRLVLLLGAGGIVAAAVVGLYLPTRVPSSLWADFAKAQFYVAGGTLVMAFLPVLLAAALPMRSKGPAP